MNFSVEKTSFFALNILKQYSSGVVHSVYRKTINLSFNGQLIAIQAAGSPLSPISLITELDAIQMQNLGISVGDHVTVRQNQLVIKNARSVYTFSLHNANVFHTYFAPDLGTTDIQKLASSVKNAIASVGTGGFDIIFNHQVNDSTSLPIIVASKRIETGKALFIEGNYSEAANELARLIGLGTGLTPSGDDFLCGLLAGVKITEMENHPFVIIIKERIQEHLVDTIDVSAAFLSCALKNEFSLAVNSLAQVPFESEIKESFLAIGHSSGIDTLCGVYFALELAKL